MLTTSRAFETHLSLSTKLLFFSHDSCLHCGCIGYFYVLGLLYVQDLLKCTEQTKVPEALLKAKCSPNLC